MSDDTSRAPRRRLRVPVALAVGFVGSSAAVSAWYGGCHAPTDPPVDAIHLDRGDADLAVDAAVDDAPTGTDAATPPDDAAPPPDSPDH